MRSWSRLTWLHWCCCLLACSAWLLPGCLANAARLVYICSAQGEIAQGTLGCVTHWTGTLPDAGLCLASAPSSGRAYL